MLAGAHIGAAPLISFFWFDNGFNTLLGLSTVFCLQKHSFNGKQEVCHYPPLIFICFNGKKSQKLYIDSIYDIDNSYLHLIFAVVRVIVAVTLLSVKEKVADTL